MSLDQDILKPLVTQILQLADDPVMENRKRMWADHQSLNGDGEIPVCVWWDFIPEPQWKSILGSEQQCRFEPARSVEWDLRKRLWAAVNIPDDHIVWPTVTVPAVASRPVNWGVDFSWSGTDDRVDDPLEAKRIEPAFPDGIDLSRLVFRDWDIDDKATRLAVEQVRELTGNRLRVVVQYPDLGVSPFDHAVRMRGMENLLYDLQDAPEKIHGLMDAITSGFEQHHRRREEKGWLNIVASPEQNYLEVGFRVHCAYAAPGFDPQQPRLHDEWAYISAQTSAGLSPAMFAEFVHPYNARLARMYSNYTVYFHGCEQLDHKLDTLAGLPNLRRFHVSPWSSVTAAREKFRGTVVLEVHAHPGQVFFGFSRAEMKADAQRLVAEAEGVPMDLNLSDIHSVNNDPGLMSQWALAARAAVEGVGS